MIVRNQYNLDYKENGPVQQYTTCPKCSIDRKKKNVKCLGIHTEKRVFNCNHCGWKDKLDGWKQDKEYKKPIRTGWSNFSDKTALFLAGRGFSEPTIKANKIIEKWAYSRSLERQVLFVGYPYFQLGEKDPVNVKWRCLDEKSFMQEAGAMPIMYNLPLWAMADEVIIVEGENDVMAFNEAGFMNCTTTNIGAINEKDENVDGKLESFHNCYQYIKNKKVVYLATDNDGPGRRLRDELIKRIGAEKCKTISFPEGCKDPNEVLLTHGKHVLVDCHANAKVVPVSGIYYLADSMDAMLDTFQNGIERADRTHFGSFDDIFRWKKGQVNLWTGYANFGKTSFFLQVALTKSILDGWKWVVFSPENYPANDFYDDIIEMYAGKHVSNTYSNKMSLDEYMAACEFINEHFFFVYPEDEHTIEMLHEKFALLMLKHGIDGVLVDPYNQVEKSQHGMRSDEEISEFMRIVKRFCLKQDISYNIIAHPKLVPKLADGEMPAADAYDVSGGAMWANKSDNIVSVHRPYWHKDKRDGTTSIHTQKIKRKRTGGQLGEVIFQYDFMCSRYYESGSNSTRKYLCDPNRKAAYDDSRSAEMKQANLWNESAAGMMEEGPF